MIPLTNMLSSYIPQLMISPLWLIGEASRVEWPGKRWWSEKFCWSIWRSQDV